MFMLCMTVLGLCALGEIDLKRREKKEDKEMNITKKDYNTLDTTRKFKEIEVMGHKYQLRMWQETPKKVCWETYEELPNRPGKYRSWFYFTKGETILPQSSQEIINDAECSIYSILRKREMFTQTQNVWKNI